MAKLSILDHTGLNNFLENLKKTFSKIGHTHTILDITDYSVDASLSSTSTKPVQNKVINSALNTKLPKENLVTCTKQQFDTWTNSGSINSDYYYFITDDADVSPTLIQYVTLSASGWAAGTSEYTQTTTASQITSNDNPMVIKFKPYSMTQSESVAYNKAFSVLCDGIGETVDGAINWKTYSKINTDITVGLIKILA